MNDNDKSIDESTEELPEVKKEVLREWRDKYWNQLDKTMKVLITIRDTGASDKDCIEAGKAIARMLGVLSADKVESSRQGGLIEKPKLKRAHSAELESLLESMP